MKNILFVIYYLNTGGVNSSLSCLYDYLKNKNCNIRVFALCHEGSNSSSFRDVVLPECHLLADCYRWTKPQNYGARLRCLIVKIIRKICALIGLNVLIPIMSIAQKQIQKTFIPDIIVAYQENDAALFASTFKGGKRISWIHFDYTKHIPANKDESDMFSKFDQIVCVSKYTASTFQKRYTPLAPKVKCVYNLMDENRILLMSEEKLEDDKFVTDTFTLLSVGRISPEKGFSTIPKMANYLKRKNCNFRWYIIGPGNNNEELEKLKKEILINEVSDWVCWLGARTNPYPYFKQSNLFVSTSFTEACPMVFNEARVLGVPIVSTDFGSSYEFINEGVDGYITSRENLPAMLYKVMNDAGVYQTLKQGAEAFVLDDTHIYQQIDELLSI